MLFASGTVLQPRWMHWQRLFVDERNKFLCYLQVWLRCSHDPSDAIQGWDSMAALPLVVNSFCVSSVCLCVSLPVWVTYRRKQEPQIIGTSVLLCFKSRFTAEIQVYVYYFWVFWKCRLVCVSNWIWFALKRQPHCLVTSKLIYSKHW